MMDRYEPAFVQSVDELDFLRFVKDVDDQDVLDSLSVLRRRAGLPVNIPLPPMQMDSGIKSVSSAKDSVAQEKRRLFGDDDDDEEELVMEIYRVQIQMDNGLAPHDLKPEVSRYAFDEILQQEYLEEFDFVSLHEDDEVHNINASSQECLHHPREETKRQSSVLSSWLNGFLAYADKGDETTQTVSPSASLNPADSTEFQGTLNALSSIFSGIY